MFQLPPIRHPDPDIAARGRVLLILSIILSLTCIIFLPVALQMEGIPAWAPWALGAMIPFYVIMGVLTTRGYVWQSGVAMTIIQITFITLVMEPDLVLNTPLGAFYVIALFVAALTVSQRATLIFALICSAIVVVRGLQHPASTPANVPVLVNLFLMTTAALWLMSRWLQGATERAREQAETAQHAYETLQTKEQELQRQVTVSEQARTAAEAARTQVQQQLSVIQQQRETIQEMSIPLLPVTDDTLLMPLVGALDSHRLKLAQELALHQIEHGRHRFLILDITGVIVIDTQVAQGLIQLVRAAKLLGTSTVLVGMRPEVAQAVVGLGLQLSSLEICSTLREGLRYTLSHAH